MNILEKIDFLMKRNGIKNRAELSELSGIPYSTITGFYAKGYDRMKLSTLKTLADCLGVTIDYLGRDEITDPNYGLTASNWPKTILRRCRAARAKRMRLRVYWSVALAAERCSAISFHLSPANRADLFFSA